MHKLTGGPILGFMSNPGALSKRSPKLFVAPHNQVLYSGSDILAKLLSGLSEYAVTTMYMEFANGAFSVPSLTVASPGQSYFANLSGITSSDFVRVGLDGTPLFQATSSNYQSNQALFSATAAGSGTGVKGQTFGTGSVVVGGALVASPTGAFAGDIVYARFYFPTSPVNQQVPVTAGQQMNIIWPANFE